MENTSEKPAPKERDVMSTVLSTETHGFLSTALKILAVPAAALAGYWVAANNIRNSVYDRLKFHDGFKSIKPNDRYKKGGVATEIPIAHLPPSQRESSELIAKAVKDVSEGKTVEAGFADKIRKLDKLTEKSIAEQLAKYDGLNTIGKQWKFTHKTGRQRALLEGFTAAGIVLAAIIPLANSKTLMGLFSEKDKEKHQEQQERS